MLLAIILILLLIVFVILFVNRFKKKKKEKDVQANFLLNVCKELHKEKSREDIVEKFYNTSKKTKHTTTTIGDLHKIALEHLSKESLDGFFFDDNNR